MPEITWAPGARCARSGTNGKAVVRSLQNFHERFRRCFKPKINIYLRQKLFLTLKKNFEMRKMRTIKCRKKCLGFALSDSSFLRSLVILFSDKLLFRLKLKTRNFYSSENQRKYRFLNENFQWPKIINGDLAV